jgi:uncharacterized membrane protein
MSQPATTLDESLVGYTHVIYALHAVSAVIGIATAATIVGSFFFGLPSIVAVILNYARRSAVRGTFLESHFRWQIRTFWFGLLATITVIALSLPLLLVLVGFITLPICIGVIGLWLVYRVVRGWLALRDRRPMYA